MTGVADLWLLGLVAVAAVSAVAMALRVQRRRVAFAEAVARLGREALRVDEPDALLTAALAVAVDTLGTSVGTALRRLPTGGLRVAAELGPDATPVGTVIPLAASGSYALHVVGSARPFVSRDLRHDPRITPPRPLLDRGVVSGVAVPVPGAQGPLGVLAVHAVRRRRFAAHEVALLEAMANTVATAWEQAALREQLSHQALHDPLTGLANRTLLLDRLDQALARRPTGRPDEPGVAVALLDLDRFKSINDGLGHAVGDAVLVAVARRLAAAVRPADTLARFGGDEFALLCEDVSEEHVTDLIRRMVAVVTTPVEVAGTTVAVGVSVGVTTSARRSRLGSADELLREADTALYRAKEHDGDRIELFDERLQAQATARARLESQLRTALAEDQLVLHYQPIRSTDAQQLIGLEALVRWRHPTRGLLPPEDFLPVAEQHGLIVPLGRWALREACRQTARWQRELDGPPDRPLRISVNVSPRQLDDPELVGLVASCVADSGLLPGTLTLEITETALLDGGRAAQAALSALVDAGAGLVLDDFGTGYSSLTHLARFPIRALKIDRSFVAGLGGRSRDGVIVAAVIALGAELGLDVIAEGVETTAQLEALREMGCPAVQGYLLDRPAAQPSWAARLPLQRLG